MINTAFHHRLLYLYIVIVVDATGKLLFSKLQQSFDGIMVRIGMII